MSASADIGFANRPLTASELDARIDAYSMPYDMGLANWAVQRAVAIANTQHVDPAEAERKRIADLAAIGVYEC